MSDVQLGFSLSPVQKGSGSSLWWFALPDRMADVQLDTPIHVGFTLDNIIQIGPKDESFIPLGGPAPLVTTNTGFLNLSLAYGTIWPTDIQLVDLQWGPILLNTDSPVSVGGVLDDVQSSFGIQVASGIEFATTVPLLSSADWAITPETNFGFSFNVGALASGGFQITQKSPGVFGFHLESLAAGPAMRIEAVPLSNWVLPIITMDGFSVESAQPPSLYPLRLGLGSSGALIQTRGAIGDSIPGIDPQQGPRLKRGAHGVAVRGRDPVGVPARNRPPLKTIAAPGTQPGNAPVKVRKAAGGGMSGSEAAGTKIRTRTP